MNQTLKAIHTELMLIINDINIHITDERPFNITTGGWNCPGLGKTDLIRKIQKNIDLIDRVSSYKEPENINQLDHYIPSLSFLRNQTLPYIYNGNAAGSLPPYTLTMDGLCLTISSLWPELAVLDAEESSKSIKNIKTKIRSLESNINRLEPKTDSLDNMVSRIESAYLAADKLPADLDDLAEAKSKIDALLDLAEKNNENTNVRYKFHKEELEKYAKECSEVTLEINDHLAHSSGLLEQLKQLHRIGTSTVLAGAFNSRAKNLNISVYIWLSILISALGAAWFIGHERALILTELLRNPTTTTAVIVVQSILMVMSMGAPIWLGWVSTKQISQRFKLAEDYYYKASISNAYEGYRREAVDLDDDFRRKLFQSALNHLGEQPLRVMDIENHGSPLNEVLNRPGFWSFMTNVFGNKTDVPITNEKTPLNSIINNNKPTEVKE